MSIGSNIKIKDLKMEGLTFLNVPSAVVVSVKTARVLALEEEEEEEEESTEGGEEGAESSETPSPEE